MKKIEKKIYINGTEHSIIEDIISEYYEMLNPLYIEGKHKVVIDGIYYQRAHSLIGRLSCQIKKYPKSTGYNKNFLRFLKILYGKTNHYDHLRKFILATPSYIKKVVKLINKFQNYYNINFGTKDDRTNEGKILDDIFNYNKLPKAWLGQKMSIKTCPYCNAQYTITIKKENERYEAKYQIDHFYPQSLYPYLAISFYNLIPSCSNCNHSKSNKDTFVKEIYHPYQDDVHKKLKFNTKPESDKAIIEQLINSGKLKEDNIEIEPFGDGSNKFKNYCDFFHIKDIYKQHNDVVYEIYAKSVLYPSSRKEELENLFEEDKLNLFEKEEITRFILGNYTDEKDFHKRPLSKLTHDIAKDLGLI